MLAQFKVLLHIMITANASLKVKY